MTTTSMSTINQHLKKAAGSRVDIGSALVRGLANKPSGEIRLSDILISSQQLDLTQLSTMITAGNGWINDATMGWRRDTYAWTQEVALTLPSPYQLSKLRRLEATIHGYYNTPANSISQNRLIANLDDGSVLTLGTQDAWDYEPSGQDIYLGDEGFISKSRSDVINRRVGVTVPAARTVTALKIMSSGYNGNGTNYPISKRGIKDLQFFFKE